MVAVLVNMRARARHLPREARVAREEGVHLVLLVAQVLADVTRRHDDANRVLRRVERPPRVGYTMEMERALLVFLRVASKLLARVGRHRRLDRLPLAALVEGDLRAQLGLLVALAVRIDLLVGDINTFDALHLFEVAPPLRVALVVAQREGEAQPLGVGEVDVAVARVVVAVVDVQEDGPF